MDDSVNPTPAPQNRSSGLNQIPIEVTVSVGKARPLIKDLLALGESAVLALDRRIDDPVELYIGEKLIARGELQEAEDGTPGQLAVRLIEVIGDANDFD